MTTYFTHDNGGQPFRVEVGEDNVVKVFDNYPQPISDSQKESKKNEPVFETKFKTLFIDEVNYKDPDHPCHGSSVLLFVDNKFENYIKYDFKYIYIGDSIVEFTTLFPVLQFVSKVCGLDVCYPVAVTKHHVILMEEERRIIPREDVDGVPFSEMYDYYYKYPHLGSKLPVRTVVERRV